MLRTFWRFVTTGLVGILASFVGKEWTAKSIGAVCLLLAQVLQRWNASFWKLWTLINIWEVVALPSVWVASVTFSCLCLRPVRQLFQPLVGVETVRVIGLLQ
ncbi:hypothetical protein AK812_SmicGene37123 [Symbiodinium microadriaticum]|uniref:Uncharacterized protein n=1 Tax=Symbiodinium microadriaticum TaxID=2951 RepID=A0A1Q9CH36_SYMMI|nr:hypothetical protein AK812_SmicGene37123 [Symbiodinium microadriaticum]